LILKDSSVTTKTTTTKSKTLKPLLRTSKTNVSANANYNRNETV